MSLRGRIGGGGGSKSSLPPSAASISASLNNTAGTNSAKFPLSKHRLNNSNIPSNIQGSNNKTTSVSHNNPSSNTYNNSGKHEAFISQQDRQTERLHERTVTSQQQQQQSSSSLQSDHDENHSTIHQPPQQQQQQQQRGRLNSHINQAPSSTLSSLQIDSTHGGNTNNTNTSVTHNNSNNTNPASSQYTNIINTISPTYQPSSLSISLTSPLSSPLPGTMTSAQYLQLGEKQQFSDKYPPHWQYPLIPIQVQRAGTNINTASPFAPMSIDPGVKVVLRIRPPNKSEIDEGGAMTPITSPLTPSSATPYSFQHGNNNNNSNEIFGELSQFHVVPTTTTMATMPRFNFDLVLSPAHTQQDSFNNVALPMLAACLQGYNSTILCYGQSGSGKTTTLLGMDSVLGTGKPLSSLPTTTTPTSTNQSTTTRKLTADQQIQLDQEGIIPRSLRHIYQQLDHHSVSGGISANFQWQTYCSLLEVYNDKVYDLLDTNCGKPILSQDVEKQGNMVATRSFSEAQQLIHVGLKNRKVATTLLNAQSSRSHLIFILYLSTTHTTAEGSTIIHNSKLTLVDLAGSERVRKSGVLSEHLGGNSEQLDEATHINKSLSHLSNVINKINYNNEHRSSNFVPYRDSALTRLLRDSLGGNSLTCVITCVSPSRVQEQETVSTLRFAESVRKVRNRIALNEIKHSDRKGGGGGDIPQEQWDQLVQVANTRQQQLLLQSKQQSHLIQILTQIASHRTHLQQLIRGIKDVSGNTSINELQSFLDAYNFTPHLQFPTPTHTLLTTSLTTFDTPLDNPTLALNQGVVDPVIVIDQAKVLLNQLITSEQDIIAESDSSGEHTQCVDAFTLEFKLQQTQKEYSNLQEIHSVLIKDHSALDDRCELLTQELSTSNDTILTQSNAIASYQKEISGLNDDISTLNDQINHVTMQLENCQDELHNEQQLTQQLNTELSNETERRIGLEGELERKKEEIEYLNEKLTIETERADMKEAALVQCEEYIGKLTRKLQQTVTERDQIKDKCIALEDKYTVYLQKCATKIQNMKSDHETALSTLQELHQQYTTKVQLEHQTRDQQQSDLITVLTEKLTNECVLTEKLQKEIETQDKVRNELDATYKSLQQLYSKQTTLFGQVEKESNSRAEKITTLEQQLSQKSQEYETLFQMNLSLSSHNNDQQKIKMQEILRDRLKIAETKLRETQIAYDELHQKYYVHSQRNRLPLNGGNNNTNTNNNTATTAKDAVITPTSTVASTPTFANIAPIVTVPSTTASAPTPTTTVQSVQDKFEKNDKNNDIIEKPSLSQTTSTVNLNQGIKSTQQDEVITPNNTNTPQSTTTNLPIPPIRTNTRPQVLPTRSLKHKQLSNTANQIGK